MMGRRYRRLSSEKQLRRAAAAEKAVERASS